MKDSALQRLRKSSKIHDLIEHVEKGQILDPITLALESSREALQVLYETGSPPTIDETESSFLWHWSGDDHDHWMVIEESDGNALAWVAPDDIWPHSRWLLKQLAGLKRAELVVDRSLRDTRRQARHRSGVAPRKKRAHLADWLARHRDQITHLTVLEGEYQGLCDRLFIECKTSITLPSSTCLINTHWEIDEDCPLRLAPYVRNLAQPWAYQTIERWEA